MFVPGSRCQKYEKDESFTFPDVPRHTFTDVAFSGGFIVKLRSRSRSGEGLVRVRKVRVRSVSG